MFRQNSMGNSFNRRNLSAKTSAESTKLFQKFLRYVSYDVRKEQQHKRVSLGSRPFFPRALFPFPYRFFLGIYEITVFSVSREESLVLLKYT